MQYILKKRALYLAVIFTAFSFSQAEAQIWGSLKNAIKKKAEEVVTKEIGGKPAEKSKKSKQEKTKTASNQGNSQKQIPASIGKPSSLDIVGLKLGMTPDQVVDFLKKRNKDFKIDKRVSKKSRFMQSGYVALIKASRPDNRESIEVVFSDPISKNLSVAIWRKVKFEAGQQPTTKAVKEGLIKKYGTPSSTTTSSRLVWLFNSNDTVIKNKRKPNVMMCIMGSLNQGISLKWINDMINPKCGRFARTKVSGGDVARGFYVMLTDTRLIAENFARTEKYIADQKASEAQKRKEKASKVKVDTDF